MSDPTPSEQRAASSTLGDLLGEVTRNLSTLMRQEITLAKVELTESAKTSGKSAGLLGGAGYAAAMAVLFLSIALWAALSTVMGGGWAGVIVAVIWAAVAAILYATGRKQMAKVKGAPQTVQTLQEFPPTFQRNEENK